MKTKIADDTSIECILCNQFNFFAYWFRGNAICIECINDFVNEFGTKKTEG